MGLAVCIVYNTNPDKVLFTLLTVSTEMGGRMAPVRPEAAAKDIIHFATDALLEDSSGLKSRFLGRAIQD